MAAIMIRATEESLVSSTAVYYDLAEVMCLFCTYKTLKCSRYVQLEHLVSCRQALTSHNKNSEYLHKIENNAFQFGPYIKHNI